MMLTQFNSTISSLPKYNHYYIGVSGGVDSIVLLDLFIKSELQFTVLHFNHNWRKNSGELKLLQELSNKLSFKLITAEGTPIKQTENEAREQRWNFFTNNVKDGCLVLAHQLEDNIETFLLQISRGTRTANGIKQVSQLKGLTCIRPLLDIKKQVIIDYAKENHLEWIEDYTNKDTKFKRNLCRNSILPLIEKLNQNALNHIHNFIKFNQNTEFEHDVTTDNPKLSVQELNNYASKIKSTIIKEWLTNNNIKGLNSYHINKCVEVSEGKITRHNLPNNKFLCRKNKQLYIK